MADPRRDRRAEHAAGVVASGGNAIVTGTNGPFGDLTDFATVAYQRWHPFSRCAPVPCGRGRRAVWTVVMYVELLTVV